MVAHGKDGRVPKPGSLDHGREIVRVCDAVSEFEGDVARTVRGEPTAQVYTHLRIAFPAELSRRQRKRIMTKLTRRFDEARVPYAVALHRPSSEGDQRNFHLHAVLSLRPFELDGPDLIRFGASKHQTLLDRTGLRILREDTVHEFNHALREVGSEVRFTAQARSERGLDDYGQASAAESAVHQAQIAAGRASIAALDAAEHDRRRFILAAETLICLDARLAAIAQRYRLAALERLRTAAQSLRD